MIIVLSCTVTKFRYYRPGVKNFLADCNWGLGDHIVSIWSKSDEKWRFYKHFCEFGARWPNWTKLLRDPQVSSATTSDMFANTLESFGAFDLGMTLTLKVKVKVTRPTRGLTVTTIIIGLWLIAIELWAWYHTIRTSFGICDLGMTLTLDFKVNVVRPTRGLPNKKKIIGLSLTVTEI